ncbi:response regulator transcription factor [Dyella sp. 333MFSha]|jgi:DNA-binding NarL/FixJ family response regulator|uniref:response regulator n=1 Tax=Dyella sp. 333MFSha TaxID=1798240 RepID=UPI0008908F12|nr:response regulator transcription factor [Dyella sp. 333MFSha]SDG79643.1 DNA-binding response regulator, NarL/FixJ family, contains REC and HTH domains [Dyella sp. 333MFSha]
MHTHTVERPLNHDGPPRIVFADDHRMVAQGIERLLEDTYDLVALVEDGGTLMEAIAREAPDLVLSDVNMPRGNGLEVLKALRARGDNTPFVFLTMHAEPALAAMAMKAGANGYVLKMAAGEELLLALREVLAGSTYVTPSLGVHSTSRPPNELRELTPKQREVLRLVGTGLRSRQIAEQLGLSARTVEAHKYMIMQILGVHSTVELVRRAEDLGLLL